MYFYIFIISFSSALGELFKQGGRSLIWTFYPNFSSMAVGHFHLDTSHLSGEVKPSWSCNQWQPRWYKPWVCPLLLESMELQPLAWVQSAKFPPHLCILMFSLLRQELVCLHLLLAAMCFSSSWFAVRIHFHFQRFLEASKGAELSLLILSFWVASRGALLKPSSLKFRQRMISRVLAIHWELELRQWLLKIQLELLMVRSWSQSNPSQQNYWKAERPVSGVCPTEHMFGTWKRKGTSQGTWIRPVEQDWKLEHCYKAKISLF